MSIRKLVFNNLEHQTAFSINYKYDMIYIVCVLGSLNCWKQNMSVCYPWAMALILQSTKPFLTPGRFFFFIWQSTAVIWKFESRWYRINALSTMFCCCFVVDSFSYCLSQDAFGAEVVKVLFHESLGIQYSSSGYNHVFVDDFQNQIWSQIGGQPSIFIFIYTYDYICILYTDWSNLHRGDPWLVISGWWMRTNTVSKEIDML